MAKTPYRKKARPPVWTKDQRVTLERWTETGKDAHGQKLGQWDQLASDAEVWAAVEPLNVRTAEYAHQLYAQATHRVFIDYRTDVDRHCRIVLGTRALYVGHVIDLHEGHVTLELLCVEANP